MAEEHPERVVAVYLFLLRDDGKVLFLRRQNTGYGDGKLSLVAGHLDPGEVIVDAMTREAAEEVGVGVDAADLELVGVMQRGAREAGVERLDFFFAAKKWSGEPRNLEPEKCAQLLWVDPAVVPAEEEMVAEVREALRCFPGRPWFLHRASSDA